MISKEHLNENLPEYSGALVSVIGIALAALGKLDLTISSLSSFSSLITQIMATYSGLVLTAYTVFHGMKVNSDSYLKEVSKSLSNEELVETGVALEGIHTIFKQSIRILVGSTLLGGLIYLVTLLNLPTSGDFTSPHFVNGVTASVLFGLFTAGSLNVFGAVACLYDLRGI